VKVQVTFSVDVTFLGPVKTGDLLAKRIEEAVAQAVNSALGDASYLPSFSEVGALSHDWEAILAIVLDSEVVAKLVV
jgi:hypothetical protein